MVRIAVDSKIDQQSVVERQLLHRSRAHTRDVLLYVRVGLGHRDEQLTKRVRTDIPGWERCHAVRYMLFISIHSTTPGSVCVHDVGKSHAHRRLRFGVRETCQGRNVGKSQCTAAGYAVSGMRCDT